MKIDRDKMWRSQRMFSDSDVRMLCDGLMRTLVGVFRNEKRRERAAEDFNEYLQDMLIGQPPFPKDDVLSASAVAVDETGGGVVIGLLASEGRGDGVSKGQSRIISTDIVQCGDEFRSLTEPSCHQPGKDAFDEGSRGLVENVWIGTQDTEEFAGQSVWNKYLFRIGGLAHGQKDHCSDEFQHRDTSMVPPLVDYVFSSSAKFLNFTSNLHPSGDIKPTAPTNMKGGRMMRSSRFLPGWWIIPPCILGTIIWAVLIRWVLS